MCPQKTKKNSKPSYRVSNNLPLAKSFKLPVQLPTTANHVYFTALLDSGAALNFINQGTVTKYHIPTKPCVPPIKVNAVNDTPIGTGITQQTVPIPLQIGLFHTDMISFYVIPAPRYEIILGYPWLALHDPLISWQNNEVVSWSTHCHANCLNVPLPKPCLTTSIESQETKAITPIPECYASFQEVVSKTKAEQLPPHREWDCAIDLLPNAMPPKSEV